MNRLFEELKSPEHLLTAYRLIQSKKYDPILKTYDRFVMGLDGHHLRDVEKDPERLVEDCRQFLENPASEFDPIIFKTVPKSEPGKMREIYLFTLRDKILQKGMELLLQRHFEKIFYPNLYSFRRPRCFTNRSAALKIKRLLRERPEGYYIFRTDIKEYSNYLNLKRVMEQFSGHLPDEPRLLEVFLKFLHQPRVRQGVLSSPILGVAAGSSLAPLCVNVYLIPLDVEMFRRRALYIRFGDDMIVLAKDPAELEEGESLIRSTVRDYGLTLSEEKTARMEPGQPFEYLGYRFGAEGVSPRTRNLKKYRRWARLLLKVPQYAAFHRGTEAERRTLLRRIIVEMNTALEQSLPKLSWIRQFPMIDTDRELRELDRYVKDRIRLCVTGTSSGKNRRLVPEAWFRELGYKSLVNAFHRVHRKRGLGPYRGWRLYFGTNYKEFEKQEPAPGALRKAWGDVREWFSFLRASLNGELPELKRSERLLPLRIGPGRSVPP